ncbi:MULTISPECIES: hypothetical protein [unclassified Streptomyces]|uniref:hypothetical protein n=1 Tax=unclassified Streptomyces TaxID=2593676 RepID=UPI0035DD3625
MTITRNEAVLLGGLHMDVVEGGHVLVFALDGFDAGLSVFLMLRRHCWLGPLDLLQRRPRERHFEDVARLVRGEAALAAGLGLLPAH